jgi:hypothetical protein
MQLLDVINIVGVQSTCAWAQPPNAFHDMGTRELAKYLYLSCYLYELVYATAF